MIKTLLKNKQHFHLAFRVANNITFEINYYKLGSNKNAYFSTTASKLNHVRSDYNRCGQAQQDLLANYPAPFNLYKQWDSLHCLDLTESQYNELVDDLARLAQKYTSILRLGDNDIRFSDIVAMHRDKSKANHLRMPYGA